LATLAVEVDLVREGLVRSRIEVVGTLEAVERASISSRISGQIIILTNSKKTPEARVAVHAFVQGNINVSPQVISLGIVPPGEAVKPKLAEAPAAREPFQGAFFTV